MAGKVVIASMDELDIFTRTGTVVGNQIWSETHVQGGSKGGGGYVGPSGGHVAAPEVSISSSTSEKLNIFVRKDDGSEFDVRLTNAGIAVREGHRVSFIYAANKNSDANRVMAVINHSIDKMVVYDHSVPPIIQPKAGGFLGLFSLIFMIALLPLFIYLIYLGLSGAISGLSFLLGVGVLLGILFILPLMGKGPYREMLPKVRAAIKEAIDAAKQEERQREQDRQTAS